MTSFVRHATPGDFLRRAEAWLLRREAENNLILGLADRMAEDPEVFTATVEEGEDVVGACLRTPPLKLIVTDLPGSAVETAAEGVAAVFDTLPAVVGPGATARAFATAWARRRGVAARPGMRQGLYALETLSPPADPPPGRSRPATEDDRTSWLPAWVEGFRLDAGLRPGRESVETQLERMVGSGAITVWDDGGPRSIAARSGTSPNGVRVGLVYTPAEHRRRGFASAVTAAVTRAALDEGYRFCFLYTDLANPTSNALYRRLGYRRVGEALDVHFDDEPGEGSRG